MGTKPGIWGQKAEAPALTCHRLRGGVERQRDPLWESWECPQITRFHPKSPSSTPNPPIPPQIPPAAESPRRAWTPPSSCPCCWCLPAPPPAGHQNGGKEWELGKRGREGRGTPQSRTWPGNREYSGSSERSSGTWAPPECSRSPTSSTDLALSFPFPSQPICPSTVTGSCGTPKRGGFTPEQGVSPQNRGFHPKMGGLGSHLSRERGRGEAVQAVVPPQDLPELLHPPGQRWGGPRCHQTAPEPPKPGLSPTSPAPRAPSRTSSAFWNMNL